ncbi:hypothetical protein GCM10023194_07200 [Planotetraspora phitsanulokensis]|uniref:Uncharacterized protein n=1 Tax=Planotetraspora phitsanulokensis TaxID=575192 RepID=A0A8J3XGP0_9ACTN|nr:hypothetical protein Pph01_42190 [Planotetraspora phitsanulokensis]
MWDIGNRTPTEEPAWNIAGLWVEGQPTLEPGGRATVRLVPLTPAQWVHVQGAAGQIDRGWVDKHA